ncbi:hypothetical protein IWW45_002572 [Coemansia sp. RSA 485]|nr:hypothetical protein IWW45_002572 [Coemansia sp. RSA 485]
MFSRNSYFKQQKQPNSARRATVGTNDPLGSNALANSSDPLLLHENVVGAINRLEPATDADQGVAAYGQHSVLREIKPTDAQQTSRSGSFPSTGFSRARKPIRSVSSTSSVAKTTASDSPKPAESAKPVASDSVDAAESADTPGPVDPVDAAEPSSVPDGSNDSDDVAALLGPASLGRRMWQHLQTASDMSDVRAMVADTSTAFIVLPQASTNRNTQPPTDIGLLLNDNILFTEELAGIHATKFTTPSGIFGTVDQASVAALGMLPPMETIMQTINATDSPRTTLFDVLDKEMQGTALVRLRVVEWRQGVLPDGRKIKVAITQVPLDRKLVVDSAVTTLSARVHAQVDQTFAALVPGAPTPIIECDAVSVAIEQIMRFAHDIEQETPTNVDTWQPLMSEFYDHVLLFLDQLETDTNLCGDTESRRRICVALVECVEKPVIESIYLRVFASTSEDRAVDEDFMDKVQALKKAGLGLDHLGMKNIERHRDLVRICMDTGGLLARVDGVRSPAEKLKLIVDAHHLVVDRMDRLNTSGKDTLSADSILPLLIYSVVSANPPRFLSNLRFVQLFRTHALLTAQFEYCMTNIQAVTSFIQSLDPQSLGLATTLDRTVTSPALNALHSLVVNNVVNSIDVVQGVADNGKKVAVGVYDATLGRLLDSGPLLFRAPWRASSVKEEKELEEKPSPQQRDNEGDAKVISGVRTVLSSASEQLGNEISGHHLPRAHLRNAPIPAVIDRFLAMQTGDLTINDVSQLLSSYKELASYILQK